MRFSRNSRLVASLSLAAAVLAAAFVAWRAHSSAPRLDRRVAAPLDSAAAMVTALMSVTEESDITDDAVLAAGYLERHRLGLAGPFKLAEFALADSAMSPGVRRGVAWLLLRQAYFGQGYRLDSDVLRHRRDTTANAATRSRAMAAVVERMIREADDPRAGELAARLTFQLASAERIIPSGVALQAIKMAALVRDRALARRDARALIDAARASHSDPLEMLSSWRASLRFMVERPVWSRSAWEADAVQDLDEWLAVVREIAADTSADPLPAAMSADRLGRLPEPFALRLLALATNERLAPQAPVALQSRELGRMPGGAVFRSVNDEEAFAAALALAPPELKHTAARALLDAAVGMRVLAQERAWFPGHPGPSEREVRRRFGYAAIEFEEGVPAKWHPYLLRSLASATTDLQRAIPPLSVAGARVRFAASSPNDSLLALHVAQTRTIVLPVATGSGTLAHELAHDIDARAARLRYGRGGYATDLAVRQQDGRMAASVAGLARTPLVAPGEGKSLPHRQRPAEVFARTMEWLVPASLARDARMNGFLSSVQDEILTGDGSVLPEDISPTAAPVLSDVLDEMMPLDAHAAAVELRRRFAGTADWTAARIVRLVMETPIPDFRPISAADPWSLGDPIGSLENALPAQPPICSESVAKAVEWRDQLLRLTVDARLRGIARSRAGRNALGAASVAKFIGMAGPWDDNATETFVERARQAMLSRLYDRLAVPAASSSFLRENSPGICMRDATSD